ncbi:helix-turn-helix domain-containing protein [Spirillospora sp. NPDC049024]
MATEGRNPMGDRGISVDALLDRLGTTVLTPVNSPPNGGASLTRLLVRDPDVESPEICDAVLLGADLAEAPQVADQLEALCPGGLAALIVGPGTVLDDHCLELSERHGVALIRSTGALSWSQLAEAIWRLLAVSEQPIAGDSFLATTADLFELANTVSTLIGAPVTIENLSSDVLAFSHNQQDVDPARTASILGLRVPDRWQEEYRSTGIYGRIYQQKHAVWVPSIDGMRRRLAVAVTAGHEVLGSMWAAIAETPTPGQIAAFESAADFAAVLLLRRHHEADPHRRRQEDLLRAVLDGTSAAHDAAFELGLGDRSICVLAARVIERPSGARTERSMTRAARRASQQRLRQSLSLHLISSNPRVTVAMSESCVHVVYPLAAKAEDAQRAVDAARVHVFRAEPNEQVIIGVGRVARDVDEIPLSRADADGVLDLLAVEHGLARVASVTDVQGHLLLQQTRRSTSNRGLRPSRALAALYAYDADHNAGLVDALAAYLDCFGNAPRAAERLHIHPNTLRYRMRSVVRIAGIDLEDTSVRFELMLQLRLHADLWTAVKASYAGPATREHAASRRSDVPSRAAREVLADT